jgi:DNA-binding transcriptional ArsR family regulator
MKREFRERFCWIQNEILENDNLNGQDIMVYLALARYANNDTQTCYPSYNKLCKIARVSRPTISKALKTLEECGIISVERSANKVNHYCLLHIHSSGKDSLLVKKSNGTGKKEIPQVVKMRNTNYTNITNTNLTKLNGYKGFVKKLSELKKI